MGTNVLPLLRPQDIKWGSAKLDGLKDFKNVFVEAADGPFAHILLSYGSKLASPHIADEFKDDIYAVLDQVEENDSSEAVQKAIDLVDALVQSLVHLSPGVKEIVSSVLSMLKGILLTLLPPK